LYGKYQKWETVEKAQSEAKVSVPQLFLLFFLYRWYGRNAIPVNQPALRDDVTEYGTSAILLYPAQSFGLYQTRPERGDFFERRFLNGNK